MYNVENSLKRPIFESHIFTLPHATTHKYSRHTQLHQIPSDHEARAYENIPYTYQIDLSNYCWNKLRAKRELRRKETEKCMKNAIDILIGICQCTNEQLTILVRNRV